jgi:hypothetical protein
MMIRQRHTIGRVTVHSQMAVLWCIQRGDFLLTGNGTTTRAGERHRRHEYRQ